MRRGRKLAATRYLNANHCELYTGRLGVTRCAGDRSIRSRSIRTHVVAHVVARARTRLGRLGCNGHGERRATERDFGRHGRAATARTTPTTTTAVVAAIRRLAKRRENAAWLCPTLSRARTSATRWPSSFPAVCLVRISTGRVLRRRIRANLTSHGEAKKRARAARERSPARGTFATARRAKTTCGGAISRSVSGLLAGHCYVARRSKNTIAPNPSGERTRRSCLLSSFSCCRWGRRQWSARAILPDTAPKREAPAG